MARMVKSMVGGVALAASLAIGLTVAGARDLPLGLSGGDWNQRFDPSSRGFTSALTSDSPMLSEQSLYAVQQALANYQQIAASGGWGTVPDGGTLRIGMADERVVALRKRLMVTNDLAQSAGTSRTYDSYVQAAVRRFQARHGILPDGMVRGDTLRQLNVPVQQRITLLSLNYARLSALSQRMPERYVIVNIPGAEIEAVDNGRIHARFTAVVGKIDRASPILESKIHEINFNPYWHAPVSIVRRDIIPKMQEDPEYLSKFNIRIFDRSGNEIDPQTVNWQTNEAENYLLRQDPGDFNSMGAIKINFHNRHSVYLHDTPETTLFGTNARFHSSGCVRVQNVRELVTWLVEPNGSDWNRRSVDALIRSGERRDVDLSERTTIRFAYITAWATPDGVVHFRPDIYNKDAAGDLAIEGSPA